MTDLTKKDECIPVLMVNQRINSVVYIKVLGEPSVILLSVSLNNEKGDHRTRQRKKIIERTSEGIYWC